jgi:hypothetical protein
MPADISNAIDSLLTAVGQIPPAIFAMLLLAGPTAAWIIYRSVVVPRRSRFAGDDPDLLWICENCRSANQVRRSHCYRCGYDREKTVGDLHVVDRDGLVALGQGQVSTVEPAVPVGAGPGVPVGPGRTLDAGQPAEFPALAPRPDVQRPRVAVTSGTAATPVVEPELEPEPDPADVVREQTA